MCERGCEKGSDVAGGGGRAEPCCLHSSHARHRPSDLGEWCQVVGDWRQGGSGTGDVDVDVLGGGGGR